MKKSLNDIFEAGPASKNRKKAEALYRGLNTKISKQVVDALYEAEEFILKAYNDKDWTLNDIVIALSEHFTFKVEEVKIGQHKGTKKVPAINSNHLKKFLSLKGFEDDDLHTKKSSRPTKRETEETKKYLRTHKAYILKQRKEDKKSITALCEEHNISIYYMTQLLGGKI